MRAGLCIAVVAALVACKDDPEPETPAPEPVAPRPEPVAGLAAIPQGADAVVWLDVAKLRDSALVRRGLRAALAGDPGLEARLTGLLDTCGLDPAKDLESVAVATGTAPTQAVLVVTGALDDTKIPACVEATLRNSGGTLERGERGGRAVFKSAPARGQPVWFAFGGPRTVVASTDAAWLDAALGPGPKVADDAELMAVMERADRSAAIWAAGRVRPEVGGGLQRVTGGAISAPPRFMFAHLHLDKGVRGQLGAVMASEKDAAKAAQFAREQLRTYEVIAQGAGFGKLVSRLRVQAQSDTVSLRLTLSAEQLKEVISQIDRGLDGE